jgi:hypothetical protein
MCRSKPFSQSRLHRRSVAGRALFQRYPGQRLVRLAALGHAPRDAVVAMRPFPVEHSGAPSHVDASAMLDSLPFQRFVPTCLRWLNGTAPIPTWRRIQGFDCEASLDARQRVGRRPSHHVGELLRLAEKTGKAAIATAPVQLHANHMAATSPDRTSAVAHWRKRQPRGPSHGSTTAQSGRTFSARGPLGPCPST